MFYVPMFKNRQAELRIIRQLSGVLIPNVIPLVEVICDTEKTDPLRDTAGKIVYAPPKDGKKRRQQVLDDQTTRTVTLDIICDCIASKPVFVDYFRFKPETYGRNSFDPTKVKLALQLSRDEQLYISKLLQISQFENLIPVISIKPGFRMNKSALLALIMKLQEASTSIALRITEEFLDEYQTIIESKLRLSDYLLYDIGEQAPKSKHMELPDLASSSTLAQKILLNSPRKRAVNNIQYATDEQPTPLIDNSAFVVSADYGLQGFGDYCGLKDNLPSNGGSGQGAALALMFVGDENGFRSYVNTNSRLGQSGFGLVKDMVLSDIPLLDPDSDCIAVKKIQALGSKPGGWQSWIEIIALRYVHQICKLLL